MCSVAIAFGSLVPSGCSDSYQAEPFVTPPPGTGATGATGAVGSGSAGRAGGRSGSSAPPRGGTIGLPPETDAGSSTAGSGWEGPLFNLRLEGSNLIVDVRNPNGTYYLTCSDAVTVQKLDVSSGSWVRPLDQRPPYSEPGYYLDGRFVPRSNDEGCDVRTCQHFGTRHFVAQAAEYVQTGSVRILVGNAHVIVPAIETRPLVGEVRVRVQYAFGDPSCSKQQEDVLQITIPPFEGVCCAIGNEGCNNTGPVGGWALSYDSCVGILPSYDMFYREVIDNHGCPMLVEDHTMCCGCDDAGVAF